jgi:hypothetical protein
LVGDQATKRAKGVEPSTIAPVSTEKTAIGDAGGVNAALAEMLERDSDPDLAEIVIAWPELPADVRKMIAGVVRLTPRQAKGAESRS